MDKLAPKLLILGDKYEQGKKIDELKNQGFEYLDLFDAQAEELAELTAIAQKKSASEIIGLFKESKIGTLVIYPWLKKFLRILDEEDYYSLLTSRNKYLINAAEQEKFKESRLAVAGLSVGSNIVLAAVMQGGCKNIKIADGDEISTSNMNRIIASLLSVNEKKTIALAKRLYEINPYLNIDCYSGGINEENISDFCSGADIIFDEIDSLNLKLELRNKAKEQSIPLIMITDNGDNVMVDIERYDQSNELLPFHGLLSSEDLEMIKKSHGQLSPQERVKLSLKIVQPQNAVPRMLDSLLEVGKTLKTWPQLATASFLAGSTGSYIIRKIANNDPLNSGRLHVSIDSVLIPNYSKEESADSRKKKVLEFTKHLENR